MSYILKEMKGNKIQSETKGWESTDTKNLAVIEDFTAKRKMVARQKAQAKVLAAASKIKW